MKELEDLTPVEKSILVMAANVLNHSLHAHRPKQMFLKKIIIIKPQLKNKAFNSLVSNWFLRKHPTRGNTTYELTKKGLKAANKQFRENFNNL